MIAPLEPGRYVRTPWKNGGGVTVDIAFDGDVWRFSRTPITVAGPFSDYTGFDRMQVLVAGSGLVLQTPAGEIDVRRPFRPVRFAGETPIVSRLDSVPVEVVNLLGDRSRVRRRPCGSWSRRPEATRIRIASRTRPRGRSRR